MMEQDALPPPPPPPSFQHTPRSKTQRASVACTHCHARKVRCNVASAGAPCWNCRQDKSECKVRLSVRGKYKRQKTADKSYETEAANTSNANASLPTPSRSLSLYPPVATERSLVHPPSTESSPLSYTTTKSPNVTSTAREDSGDNIEGYKSIVDAATPTAPASLVPFFVGETQGLRFVFNASLNDSIAADAHYLVQQRAPITFTREDMAFLESRGCFALPPISQQWELLIAYFDYVHPLLPVVDATSFLREYELKGASGVSLLLLHTMFLAASSFTTPDFLRRAGYPSVTALKKSFYQRAKTLYDCDHENDKFALIQAVLLMGYWYSESHDRADSWHWIGIATSLAQSIGLHRDPKRSMIPTSQRRFYRRLWWCCFYRDHYVALGMGRPMRVHHNNCDQVMVSVDDLVNSDVPSDLSPQSRAIIEKSNALAPIFVQVAKLSILLGDVLRFQYRAVQSKHKLDSAIQYEEALTRWYEELEPSLRIDRSVLSGAQDPITIIHKHNLHTMFQFTVIALERPLMFGTPDQMSDFDAKNVNDVARSKAIFAATAATESLRQLIEQDLLKCLPPESVSAIASIIPIIFLERLWASDLRWQAANQKLELCLMILSELEHKYWPARFVQIFFDAAFRKVASGRDPIDSRASASGSSRSAYVRTICSSDGARTPIGPHEPPTHIPWIGDTSLTDPMSPGMVLQEFAALFDKNDFLPGFG